MIILGVAESITGFGHNGEPTRPWLEVTPPSLLVRRGTNQCRQRSLHQITFHSSDSHKRIRHRRSPSVQSVRVIRRHTVVTTVTISCTRVLVQTTPKRSRMRRRRAETRLLRSMTPRLIRIVITITTPIHVSRRRRRRNRTARRRVTMTDRKPNRRG